MSFSMSHSINSVCYSYRQVGISGGMVLCPVVWLYIRLYIVHTFPKVSDGSLLFDEFQT